MRPTSSQHTEPLAVCGYADVHKLAPYLRAIREHADQGGASTYTFDCSQTVGFAAFAMSVLHLTDCALRRLGSRIRLANTPRHVREHLTSLGFAHLLG